MGGPVLDLSLLDGLRFRCRPDCGLCCYTTPAVEPAEARALLQIEPEVPLLGGEGGWKYVAGQGDGGACHFLSANRCRAYVARPFACREFPLSVHLAPQVQATAVLSCPGLARPRWAGGPGEPHPVTGLEAELAVVESELRRPSHQRRVAEAARRWDRFVRVRARRSEEVAPDRIAELLTDGLLERSILAYPPAEDPDPPESLEELPLAFMPGTGLVALEGTEREVEILRLEGTGRDISSAGRFPVGRTPPHLTHDGERALLGYLRYLLRREFTYACGAAQIDGTEAPLLETVASDLARFGALVLARAELLRQFEGSPGAPLDGDRVWAGVRATDGEFLDRATLAGVL